MQEDLTKIRNRVKEFADRRNLTPYGLWKAVNRSGSTLSETTVRKLCNDPSIIPTGKVLQDLAKAFPRSTPNDWLKFPFVNTDQPALTQAIENSVERLREDSDWLKRLSEAVRQGNYVKAKEMVEEFDRSMKGKED
ncbi:hypothetical protein [Leptolyngbya sp. FACHB-711]|uniref:hypothetical protein n=1 Tax=Leptolyngbya sp. FACHB-711 TaxID=2692813 RepID=UPI001683B84F|nr:hypothetical protein [Leptolyngbya sp. FACHB-711]MBD2025263.1 hypothetical protein [Leptolyngbya sp. FACHB-711]